MKKPETIEGTEPAAAEIVGISSDPLLQVLFLATCAVIGNQIPDLTVRQIGLLIVLREGLRTVDNLSADLGISKTAVTQALDRLDELTLTRRERATPNSAKTIVHETLDGMAYLSNLCSIAASIGARRQLDMHQITASLRRRNDRPRQSASPSNSRA